MGLHPKCRSPTRVLPDSGRDLPSPLDTIKLLSSSFALVLGHSNNSFPFLLRPRMACMVTPHPA